MEDLFMQKVKVLFFVFILCLFQVVIGMEKKSDEYKKPEINLLEQILENYLLWEKTIHSSQTNLRLIYFENQISLFKKDREISIHCILCRSAKLLNFIFSLDKVKLSEEKDLCVELSSVYCNECFKCCKDCYSARKYQLENGKSIEEITNIDIICKCKNKSSLIKSKQVKFEGNYSSLNDLFSKPYISEQSKKCEKKYWLYYR
jgi:hypothetical protein